MSINKPLCIIGLVTLALIQSLGWTPVELPSTKAHAELRALIVGGGPDPEHNQVAIESNVKYVLRLLPSDSIVRVLFADGNTDNANVLVEDDKKKLSYRKPELSKLDGAARLKSVKFELGALADSLTASRKVGVSPAVLLYFTGHGGPDEASGLNNNRFDLWSGDQLSVKELSGSIDQIPKADPVTLVMVECFSGAFGNLIFENADPNGSLSDRPICGFFASVAQRMAAGCTPAVNEAEYRDFTGYFFAALMGTDRMGRKVSGADYNGDGKVGMNEAFAYSLIHDDSIDTPVCTSDTFLRRFVKNPDEEVAKTSFADVVRWASPAQRAALDALSAKIGIVGDDRFSRAYAEFQTTSADTEDQRQVYLIRFVRLSKSVVLGHIVDTSGDRQIKNRYHQLLALESRNPLRG